MDGEQRAGAGDLDRILIMTGIVPSQSVAGGASTSLLPSLARLPGQSVRIVPWGSLRENPFRLRIPNLPDIPWEGVQNLSARAGASIASFAWSSDAPEGFGTFGDATEKATTWTAPGQLTEIYNDSPDSGFTDRFTRLVSLGVDWGEYDFHRIRVPGIDVADFTRSLLLKLSPVTAGTARIWDPDSDQRNAIGIGLEPNVVYFGRTSTGGILWSADRAQPGDPTGIVITGRWVRRSVTLSLAGSDSMGDVAARASRTFAVGIAPRPPDPPPYTPSRRFSREFSREFG